MTEGSEIVSRTVWTGASGINDVEGGSPPPVPCCGFESSLRAEGDDDDDAIDGLLTADELLVLLCGISKSVEVMGELAQKKL